jgi:DNA-binding XRE family transcriptional regulator
MVKKRGDYMNKLKGARVAKGYTQEKLAKAIGITLNPYNRKELGIVKFTTDEIIKISNLLEFTIEQVNEIFFDNKLTDWLNKSA